MGFIVRVCISTKSCSIETGRIACGIISRDGQTKSAGGGKMRFMFILFAVSCLLTANPACSSERSCSEEKDYRIEYSTRGGFTGMEKGVTIDCNGWVKWWERKLNSPKEVIDSLQADPSVMIKFDKIMSDGKLFDFTMDHIGNHTATLVLSKQNRIHAISYNSSENTSHFPESIQTILSEIEKINKQK